MSLKNRTLQNIIAENCRDLSDAITVIDDVNSDIQLVGKCYTVSGRVVPAVEISDSSNRNRLRAKLTDQSACGLHEAVFSAAQAGIHTGAKALIQDLSRTLIR